MRALHNKHQTLTLSDVAAEPIRRSGEVKVQVHYASLNPTDADIARGDLDLFLWLYRSRSLVRTGLEFSGTVMEGTARFAKGAKVFGYTHLMKGPKTHQDIISIPEDYIASIPEGMNFAQAAAFPLGAQTSLVALRDVAGLTKEKSVLILGASGGLGVYAIQIAKALQLSVTAVAGPSGQKIMTDLGADQVIDYRQTPLEKIEGTFDAVLDLSARYRFNEIRHLLTTNGVFVPADPMKNLSTTAGNVFRHKKAGFLMVEHGNHSLLTELAGWITDGSLKIGPYAEFDFDDFEAAFTSLGEPGRIGRTVLRLR